MSILKALSTSSVVAQAPVYVDDVFSSNVVTNALGVITVPQQFNIAADSDPDWSYVKRYTPCLSHPNDVVTKTFLGGSAFYQAGSPSPFGDSWVATQVAVSDLLGDDFRTSYNFPTGKNWNIPWCIEAFIKSYADVNSSARNDIVSHVGALNSNMIDIYGYTSGGNQGIRVRIRANAVDLISISDTSTAGNSWVFVSVSFTGTQLLVHVNGALKASAAFTGWITPPPATSYSYGVTAAAGAGEFAEALICLHRMTFGSARTSDRNVVPTKPFPTRNGAISDGITIIKGLSTGSNTNLCDASNKKTIPINGSLTPVDSFADFMGDSLYVKDTGISSSIFWTFKKSQKFFEKFDYVGNGSNRTIQHSLGADVGLMLVHNTQNTASSFTWCLGLTGSQYLPITSSSTVTNSVIWNNSPPTSSQISMGSTSPVNTIGDKFAAYLFANDTSPSGVIRCGTYIGTGAANNSISLGWEPQFVMIRCVNSSGSWFMFDTSMDMSLNNTKYLVADSTNVQVTNGSAAIVPNPSGFSVIGANMPNINTSGATFFYMAIRRSNKPPTSGTQVYNAVARTGTGAVATVSGVGFAPDSILCAKRGASSSHVLGSRLLGFSAYSRTSATDAEFSEPNILAYTSDGYNTTNPSVWADINWSAGTYINYFFKRAAGVFDVVCYTGSGTASQTITHGLGVAPELILTKNRTSASSWWVYNAPRGKNFYMALEYTGAEVSSANIWGTTAPSTTSFDVNSALSLTTSANNYVTYLFASLAGVSKVGSYTGNGSSQNIDCGFAAGARFVLIKRTDAAGEWYVWDSARGIIAGNDPHLSLNATAAEVTTDDSIDPLAAGFIVNQVAATNINVNAATYIYLAFS